MTDLVERVARALRPDIWAIVDDPASPEDAEFAMNASLDSLQDAIHAIREVAAWLEEGQGNRKSVQTVIASILKLELERTND